MQRSDLRQEFLNRAAELFRTLSLPDRTYLLALFTASLDSVLERQDRRLKLGEISEGEWEKAVRSEGEKLLRVYRVYARGPVRYNPLDEREHWHAYVQRVVARESGLPLSTVERIYSDTNLGYAFLVDSFMASKAVFGLYPGGSLDSWQELMVQGQEPTPDLGRRVFEKELEALVKATGMPAEFATLARGEVPLRLYTEPMLSTYLLFAESLIDSELLGPERERVRRWLAAELSSYSAWLHTALEEHKTDKGKVEVFMSQSAVPALVSLHQSLLQEITRAKGEEGHIVLSGETLRMAKDFLMARSLDSLASLWKLWELGRPWWTRTPAWQMGIAGVVAGPSLAWNLVRLPALWEAWRRGLPIFLATGTSELLERVPGLFVTTEISQAMAEKLVSQYGHIVPLFKGISSFLTPAHKELLGYTAYMWKLTVPSLTLSLLGAVGGTLFSLGYLAWSLISCRELWDLLVRSGVQGEIEAAVDAFLEGARGKAFPSTSAFWAQAREALQEALARAESKLSRYLSLPGGFQPQTYSPPQLRHVPEGGLVLGPELVGRTLSTASTMLERRREPLVRALQAEGLSAQEAEALAHLTLSQALSQLEEYLSSLARVPGGGFRTTPALYLSWLEELESSPFFSLTHLLRLAKENAQASSWKQPFNTFRTQEELDAYLAGLVFKDSTGKLRTGLKPVEIPLFLEGDPYLRGALERARQLAVELARPWARRLAYSYLRPEAADDLERLAKELVEKELWSFFYQPGLYLLSEADWRRSLSVWLERRVVPLLREELSRWSQ